MEKFIDPAKQTVEECLKDKKYFIDFYQREYVWTTATIVTLLNDIVWNFENSYSQYSDRDLKHVLDKYSWYYLNVFITNEVHGKVFIVDGQQRLTSLTLIAAYLYYRVKDDETLEEYLKKCIFSRSKFDGNVYNIDNDKRNRVMDVVFINDGNVPADEKFTSVTEKNILDRYADIKAYFDEKAFDDKKLKCFAHYFLSRLVLVELAIDKDNTPMIFEVINDRGEPLKHFEILKGKMIGALPKEDTDSYARIWEDAMLAVKGFEDDFFVDLLKCRFMTTNNSAMSQQLSSGYHRYIFETNNSIANELKFRRQDRDYIANIKTFIKNDVAYYALLYGKIRANENEFLQYDNSINLFTNQYQNILAACQLNDPDETRKIESIAREFDRMYMILRLNGQYNSNSFQDLAYRINGLVRGQKVEDFRAIFDKVIQDYIKSRLGVPQLNSLLEYSRFNQQGYAVFEARPLRYLLARVEKFICYGIGESMKYSVYDIVRKTGNKTGFHIEHILSRNQESVSKFDSEEEFDNNRNRMGGLLLLYGLDNIGSGNELYKDKLKTYSNGLMWGKTLVEDTYHVNIKLRAFNDAFKARHGGIGFEPIADFDKSALDARTKLLFEIVREIWEV